MATEEKQPSERELLARIAEATEDQARWQRAAVLPEVKKTIEHALKNARLRRAYESLDGTRSQKEIAEGADVSPAAVTLWTRSWRDLGIVYETREGTLKHLTSLKALGIDIDADGGE